ncbi:MAG TPA: rhomboid family intramembrane serine protease [Solirubrobacteraceae bacterium]|jgi:membrane associated rhomboid family serine protease|nr:rhomboid family intramembrane serine protease [Solirubrobacteraceae bacterium]
MSSGADLFVVCKQCGSEVSPYVTECPYCGNRVRRRAPKLPRQRARGRSSRGLLGRARRLAPRGRTRAPAPARRRLSRWAPEGRALGPPYATIALVAAGCAGWIVYRGGYVGLDKLVVAGPLHGDWWKLVSSQFTYNNGLYAFTVLLVVAIFGWLLERRIGPVGVLVLFFAAGVAGALAAEALYPEAIVIGANAGALALLAAWAAPDLRAARDGTYYEGDLLGAGALAALLLAIPFVLPRPGPSWLAGVTGGAIGLLFGLGTARLGPTEP